MFKFDCSHGRHETVADAKACQAGQGRTNTAQHDALQRLGRQHTNNRLARSVLGTPAPAPVVEPAFSIVLEMPEVDAGSYALEMEGTVKFYQVDRPTEGKWKGWTFLSVQASDDRYPIKNKTTKHHILSLIAANPREAMERYGRELGQCGHCHRTLTSEWRLRGIGPVCAKNLGW
jgi:hypothetical protein